jgi:hypothetical protein
VEARPKATHTHGQRRDQGLLGSRRSRSVGREKKKKKKKKKEKSMRERERERERERDSNRIMNTSVNSATQHIVLHYSWN